MNNELSLVGARTEYGTPIKVYDDGFGPCWLYREAGGLCGIVRAQSRQDAYECCQDEIMDRVPPEDVPEAYGFYVMEFGGKYWLVPDVELETDTRWEPFNHEDHGIPGRVVVGSYSTRGEALADCAHIIAEEELELVEGYEYQSNATGTGIVAYDLNGQELQPLTAELRAELGITLQVTQSC